MLTLNLIQQNISNKMGQQKHKTVKETPVWNIPKGNSLMVTEEHPYKAQALTGKDGARFSTLRKNAWANNQTTKRQ